jgi:hypothetical protein
MLKTGVRIHGIEATDKIWLTCCALHTVLLDEDGLDNEWQNGVRLDWEGTLGEHNSNDVETYVSNFALGRLQTNHQRCCYDASGVGRGADKGDADALDRWSNDEPNDNIEVEVPTVASSQ